MDYVTALPSLCNVDDSLAERTCISMIPALWEQMSAQQRDV